MRLLQEWDFAKGWGFEMQMGSVDVQVRCVSALTPLSPFAFWCVHIPNSGPRVSSVCAAERGSGVILGEMDGPYMGEGEAVDVHPSSAQSINLRRGLPHYTDAGCSCSHPENLRTVLGKSLRR